MNEQDITQELAQTREMAELISQVAANIKFIKENRVILDELSLTQTREMAELISQTAANIKFIKENKVIVDELMAKTNQAKASGV